jgi:hypothetical protein
MLAELLRYVGASAGGGVALAALRIRFPAYAGTLPVAMARGYLGLHGEVYRLTTVGRDYLELLASAAAMKRCPACGEIRSRDEFWADRSRSDGRYVYCVHCAQRAKELRMETKRETARAAISAAGRAAAGAAADWDAAVSDLALAWRAMVAAADTLRAQRRAAAIEFDSGPLELRLVHPRAMFALALALSDAGFPMGVPVLRECGWSERLTDFVGKDPAATYFPDHAQPEAEPQPARTRKRRQRRQRRAPAMVRIAAPAAEPA